MPSTTTRRAGVAALIAASATAVTVGASSAQTTPPTPPPTPPPAAPAPTMPPAAVSTTVPAALPISEADMFGVGISGSGPEYPECGPGQLFDDVTVQCTPTATPVPPATVALRTDYVCPVTTDLEGTFTAANQMGTLIECILPVALEWLTWEYGSTAVPAEWGAVSASLLPHNFIYVPTGVSGTFGCDFSDRSLSYCPWDGNVYLGEQQLWSDYREHGDADLWGSISHEVGHRIQHLAGTRIATTRRELIPTENQADCFSGAFLDYAARWGNIDSSETGDDLIDLFVGLFNIGEPDTEERSHGTIDQRIRAFFVGYNSADAAGVFDCDFYVTDVSIVPDAYRAG
jgi:hypothetical protein